MIDTKPKVIFENSHYQACVLMYAGNESLIVTRKRKQGGKHLVGPQAAEWIEAIKTAIDTSEANDLCRAVVNA